MESPPRTMSDAAGDILRQAFRKKPGAVATSFDDAWWDSSSFSLFGRIPWHQLPRIRHAPVPWFLPIDRFEQSVFAEAFRQCLAEGFAVPRAIELAAEVNPCPCFRRALRVMREAVCAGHSLASGLGRSRAWVGRALPAALEAGEELGCLPQALEAFVRQDPAFTGPRYRRAIGRRPETTRFALALAELLRDRLLTWTLVGAAGRLAGGGRRFTAHAEAIAVAMRDGAPLAEALGRFPRDFDPLFRAFLDRADCREAMSACLGRLAVAGDLR